MQLKLLIVVGDLEGVQLIVKSIVCNVVLVCDFIFDFVWQVFGVVLWFGLNFCVVSEVVEIVDDVLQEVLLFLFDVVVDFDFVNFGFLGGKIDFVLFVVIVELFGVVDVVLSVVQCDV